MREQPEPEPGAQRIDVVVDVQVAILIDQRNLAFVPLKNQVGQPRVILVASRRELRRKVRANHV